MFLVAQAVLERDDGRVRTDQRREQFWELVVGGGFQPNQHHVAHADFVRRPGAAGLNVKIAVDAADGHALLPHDVVVGAEQEMNVLPAPAESGAVKTAHRATADHGNFHLDYDFGLMDLMDSRKRRAALYASYCQS